MSSASIIKIIKKKHSEEDSSASKVSMIFIALKKNYEIKKKI